MTVRQERVQSLMVRELSEIIRRDLRDPRIGLVTVTGAEITQDLRYARIYISVLGDPTAQTAALAALSGAAGRLRGELARRARLRLAPDIEFRLDEGVRRAERIQELLHSVEADLAEPAEHSAEQPSPRSTNVRENPPDADDPKT